MAIGRKLKLKLGGPPLRVGIGSVIHAHVVNWVAIQADPWGLVDDLVRRTLSVGSAGTAQQGTYTAGIRAVLGDSTPSRVVAPFPDSRVARRRFGYGRVLVFATGFLGDSVIGTVTAGWGSASGPPRTHRYGGNEFRIRGDDGG